MRTITPAQQTFLGLSDEAVERQRVFAISADRRRTQERRESIERGVHPLTRVALRAEGGTCGDCAHLLNHAVGSRKRFFKCALVGVTFGAGTDLRKSWPACVRFAPQPDPAVS